HAVVQDLWDRGRGAIWTQMEHHFRTPRLRAATIADHRAILQALEAHDPREARHALRAHVRRVAAEFARGWERRTPVAAEARARPPRAAGRSRKADSRADGAAPKVAKVER